MEVAGLANGTTTTEERRRGVGPVDPGRHGRDALVAPLARPPRRTVGLAEGTEGEAATRFNGYRGPVIEGVITGARNAGWNMIHFCTHPVEDEMHNVEQYAYHCDGVVHFASQITAGIQDGLSEAGVPLVLVGGQAPQGGVAYIDIDNIAAARSVTEHLIQLGHRRIAILTGDVPEVTDLRIAGFRRAFEEAGLPVDERLVVRCRSTRVGSEQAPRLLSEPAARPTAVVCFNDAIALGVLRIARDLGLSVPGDLSIVGFDDILESSLVKPGLTTVRQPLRAMGERAVQLLIDVIEGREPVHACVLLKHELVIRGSTGLAPAAG